MTLALIKLHRQTSVRYSKRTTLRNLTKSTMFTKLQMEKTQLLMPSLARNTLWTWAWPTMYWLSQTQDSLTWNGNLCTHSAPRTWIRFSHLAFRLHWRCLPSCQI